MKDEQVKIGLSHWVKWSSILYHGVLPTSTSRGGRRIQGFIKVLRTVEKLYLRKRFRCMQMELTGLEAMVFVDYAKSL